METKKPVRNTQNGASNSSGINSFDAEDIRSKLELVQRDIVKMSEIQRDLESNVHTLQLRDNNRH
jgi:hypothetical protein